MIYYYVLAFTQCAIQAVSILISFFHPVGKAGGTQLQRCQGIAVKCYDGTLGALALATSGFCNAGVNSIFSRVTWIDPCFGEFYGSTRGIDVDVRIIAVTKRDLAKQVDSGKEDEIEVLGIKRTTLNAKIRKRGCRRLSEK